MCGRADADLADLAERAVATLVVADADLGARQGLADRAGRVVAAGRVAGDRAAGFRQPVTLQQRAPGPLEPALCRGAMQGRAAFHAQAQAREIDLLDSRRAQQGIVERGHAAEHRGSLAHEVAHQRRQVARVGHQHQARADRPAEQAADRERGDVVDRQGDQEHLLPGPQLAAIPGLQRQHLGGRGALGQHGALGDAGGAAGVLEEGDVVVADVHARGAGGAVPWASASLKRTAPSMR